jgi:hypothetical protein
MDPPRQKLMAPIRAASTWGWPASRCMAPNAVAGGITGR